MKKILAIVLTLAMLCLCLCGCTASLDEESAARLDAIENSLDEIEAKLADSAAPAAAEGEAEAEPTALADGGEFSFGLIAHFGNGIGLGMVNALTAWVDHVNAGGGVQIGDAMYTLNMITYDSDGNTDTAAAAVERLIYQDKVDYIISDTNIVDPWLHICEENQVVALVETGSNDIYENDWQYVYEVGAKNAMASAMDTWYFTSHDVETVVCLHPDNAGGETDSALFMSILNNLVPDLQVENISYPADSTDLSAVATKVVELDPDVFVPVGGGPNAIGNACKAVRQAGYEGDMFSTSPFAAALMLNFIDAADAEGFINCALPTEFEEPLTDLAKEFKQAYIDFYGEWDSPEVVASCSFFALIGALQEAGSTDKDAVREVLNNGLCWETPVGSYKMIGRPDYGIERTCDSVSDYYMKTIEDGKPTVIEYLDIDTVEQAVLAYFATLTH